MKPADPADAYSLSEEFEGGVEGAQVPPQVPTDRARAKLLVGADGIEAELEDGRRLRLGWRGLSVRRGGASGNVIFCRPPAGSPTFFSEAPGFLRAVESAGANEVADELARLAGERVAGRRRHAVLMLGAFLLALAVLWSIPSAFRGTIEFAVQNLPVSFDREIGKDVWESLETDETVVDDEVLVGALEEMVERLAPGGEIFGEEIEVRLVESEEANAFALPGGFLTVYTGLMREARSPEQVAAVLAHELAHVELRHGLTRIAHSIGTWAALRLVLGDSDGFLNIARDLFQLATVNDYSREQELEADRRGVELLARARIDPRAAAEFFELLRERYGDLPSSLAWMSTHPLNERRVANIEQAIAALPDPPSPEPLAIDWESVRERLAP